MELPARRRVVKVAFIALPLLLLVGVGFPFVMFHLVSPPPGPPLAVVDLRSGQAFELPFVADGRAARVFLDLQCESCSFPVTGTLSLWAGDTPLDRAVISAGNSRDRAWGGHDRTLAQHLLYVGPAPPAGTRIVLKGSLVVGAARGLTKTPLKEAPPPRVKVLRVTVAP